MEEAKVPQVKEESPYYNALLSVIAIVQEVGSCDDESLRACLESEGIGDFYSYAQILIEAAGDESISEEDESGANPADPAQENDEEASENLEG